MAKAPGGRKLMHLDPSIASKVEDMILRNRSELIRSTVTDQAAQKELVAISEAIDRLNKRSPDLVAAWGLGCGGSCLVGPDIARGDPFGGPINK